MTPPSLRTRALESLLLEKGLVSEDAIDAVVRAYEQDIGPLNGARVVARARTVLEPRSVLREFRLDLDESIEVRVWDSSAETRFMVLPERPAGTDGFSEEQLAALVTRDSMVGVARVAA